MDEYTSPVGGDAGFDLLVRRSRRLLQPAFDGLRMQQLGGHAIGLDGGDLA